jgi:hypothetical protein
MYCGKILQKGNQAKNRRIKFQVNQKAKSVDNLVKPAKVNQNQVRFSFLGSCKIAKSAVIFISVDV